MSEELQPLDRPWDTAESESIWCISGIYPEVGSTFTSCLAMVAPFYMTGTEEPLFIMISPAIQDGKPIAPKWITKAEPLILIHKESPLTAFYKDDQSRVDALLSAQLATIAKAVGELERIEWSAKWMKTSEEGEFLSRAEVLQVIEEAGK